MDREAQQQDNGAVGKQLELDFPDSEEVADLMDKIKDQDEDLYKLITTMVETIADMDKENKVLQELIKLKD